MTIGRKTGGRTKGTPNKKTQSVTETLEAMGCDPIQGMATIAMDEEQPIELRAQMFKELAQYVVPKRKAMEISGGVGVSFIDAILHASKRSKETLGQTDPN